MFSWFWVLLNASGFFFFSVKGRALRDFPGPSLGFSEVWTPADPGALGSWLRRMRTSLAWRQVTNRVCFRGKCGARILAFQGTGGPKKSHIPAKWSGIGPLGCFRRQLQLALSQSGDTVLLCHVLAVIAINTSDFVLRGEGCCCWVFVLFCF